MSTQLLDWQPNASSRLFAAGIAASGIDVATELQKFRNYRHRDELRDPDKAFVAWLKRAVGFNSAKKPLDAPSEARRSTEVDRWIAEIREFSQSHVPEFERVRKYMEAHSWWGRSGREFQLKQMLFAIRERGVIFTYLDEQGREF